MMKSISKFKLTILALTAMLSDHFAYKFIPETDNLHLALRIFGRIAFPIYCFLLIEGYFKTKNLKRYAKRILFFGIISEVPFDLFAYNKPFAWHHQNVLFTLYLGLASIYMIDKFYKRNNSVTNLLIIFTSSLLLSMLAVVLKPDYSAEGILTISLMAIIYKDLQIKGKLTDIPKGKEIIIPYFGYIIYPLHMLLFYFAKLIISS